MGSPFFRPECIPGKDKWYFRNEENRFDSPFIGRNLSIVRVRVKGLGNFHYVLLVKCQDGQFWCMDPLHAEEELVPLSAFGNRIYAIRYLYRP